MKEQFIERKFRQATLDVINAADEIIIDYQRRGFSLTLRQLYYQFVSRGLLPNKQNEYDRLGSIIDNARKAGLLDWSAIEDRTRNVNYPSVWSNPNSIIKAVANQYQKDPWLNQTYRPEVWIEKDALVGVIEDVCEELRVPYFACRGYTSQSEAYDAGKRLAGHARAGQQPVILHLGDHDPSGIDMTRDNTDRLSMFAGRRIEVRRLALNMNQIDEHNPPPNPAKETDARFTDYAAEYGDESWELDALDPDVISGLIRDELEGLTDWENWNASMAEEDEEKSKLLEVSRRWGEVSDFIEGDNDF